tara:strand:+ start:298 stop:639 length:342 start_codon:yes stop_codon:yes gene_type:complete
MTLRQMLPDWWCKFTFSVPEHCYGDYNWFDFLVYEFIFSFAVILAIKWIINCLFFILGLVIPDEKLDKAELSPGLLGKDLEIPNDEIEDIQSRDLDFDEDVFSLEESKNITKK